MKGGQKLGKDKWSCERAECERSSRGYEQAKEEGRERGRSSIKSRVVSKPSGRIWDKDRSRGLQKRNPKPREGRASKTK